MENIDFEPCVYGLFYNARNGSALVGKDGVVRISYHAAQGEGDKHYCTVHYSDGSLNTIFDIVEVMWSRSAEV